MSTRPVSVAETVTYSGLPEGFNEAALTCPMADLMSRFGRSERTIQRWMRLIGAPRFVESVPGAGLGVAKPYSFPDPDVRDFRGEGFVKLSDDLAVTSDWHAPFFDVELARNLILVCKAKGIKQLALVGDFLDLAMLSKFDPRAIEDGLKDELALGSKILAHLLTWFDVIYMSGGNHEARMLRALKFQLEYPDLVRFLTTDPRVVTTDRDVMVHDGGAQGIPYRLTHPGSYSQNSCTVAVRLAEKHDTHVMSAHGHFIGFRVSRNGKYLGIDLGGMFDIGKTPYINVGGETIHPTWNPGFWTIQGGWATPYSNLFTDWGSYDRPNLFALPALTHQPIDVVYAIQAA